MTRFYHAFKWQAVVNTIQFGEVGLAFVANVFEGGYNNILSKLTPEEKAHVIEMGDIYGERTVNDIIAASNKPDAQTWAEWATEYSTRYTYTAPEWVKKLQTLGDDATSLTHLVLVDHPNRTRNLHKIITETNLVVISNTEKQVTQSGTNVKGVAVVYQVPDVGRLYGKPSLPDFNNLTDEMHELYLHDSVSDLDDLIPVYDFSVQSLSHKQLLDAPLKKREPLVLRQDTPMLWSESLTEIFAWRGTGKTIFSLGLALHMAAGKDMPGFTIPSPRRVLYVEGELPASQLQERAKQLSKGLNVPASGVTYISKAAQQRGSQQSPVTIHTEAGRKAIEAAIEQADAEVLILDSIASLAQISTNDEAQWLPIIEWMVELRSKGMCVVYLQQAGKSGEQRGHSVSEDRLDLAIHLTETGSNPDGAAFKMTFTKEREGSLTPLRLKCTKGEWALDMSKDQPLKTSNKEDKDKGKLIEEALNAGEPQRQIADRFKVSLRDVSAINKITKETTNNDNSSDHVNS